MTTLKLKAKEKGYYNDEIIDEGRVFDWTMPDWAVKEKVPLDEAIPPWAVRVGNKPVIEEAIIIEPEMTEDERESKIISAVNKLDHTDDDHWTEAGLPAVDAVKDICGFKVSRSEIKALCPGVEREED